MKKFSEHSQERLVELNAMAFARSIVSKVSGAIKKLFNLASFSFGQRKRIRVSVPLTIDLSEAKDNRKNAGTQVEMLSTYYLGKEISKMGFDVEVRLENKPITLTKLNTEINALQKRIESNSLLGADRKKITQIRKKLAKDLAMRRNYGYATAMRLAETISKDLNDYPNMFTVVIDSAGYAGEGSTKADINIAYEVAKMPKSGVVPKLKGYAISHKANWDKAMGTQVNSVYGIVYAAVTGEGAKEGGKTKVRNTVDPLIKKKFGAKGAEMIERLDYLWSSRNERQTVQRGRGAEHITIDPKAQKEFEQSLEKFYKWVAKLIEENPLNMVKFIGIEEGVDHFMVNFNKSTKKYDTYSSIDSKKYQQFVTRMFDEEIRKEVTCKAKVSGFGVIDVVFLWRGSEFYRNSIVAQQTNNNRKSKSVVGGLGVSDFDDSKQSIEKKFSAQIPKDLVAALPDEFIKPDKPKTKRGLKTFKQATPKQKVPQGKATDMWSKRALSYAKTSSDPQIRRKLMGTKERAVQYIMAGLTPKEAIDQALGVV